MSKCVKQIRIDQLKIGMYVIEMDVSWFKTPFFRHRLFIKNDKQIDAIQRAGVTILTIDLVKGIDVELATPAITKAWKPKQTVVTTMRDEMDAATKIQKFAKQRLQQLVTAMAHGETLKQELVQPIIDETLESVLRNDNAILAVVNMKQHGSVLYNHAFNVMSLCLVVGQRLAHSSEELSALGTAALVHDIGWTQLPMHLMGKRRPYAAAEKRLIEKHVHIGMSILEKNAQFSNDIIDMVRQHHENWDGSGYPQGLRHDEISANSRLLAVVDRYDELKHGLLDHPPITPGQALQHLTDDGKKNILDSVSVNHLIDVLGVFPVMSAVLLNSGERGIVIEMNRDDPFLPKVKLFYDKDKRVLTKPFELDLAMEHASYGTTITSLVDPDNEADDPAKILHDAVNLAPMVLMSSSR